MWLDLVFSGAFRKVKYYQGSSEMSLEDFLLPGGAGSVIALAHMFSLVNDCIQQGY